MFFTTSLSQAPFPKGAFAADSPFVSRPSCEMMPGPLLLPGLAPLSPPACVFHAHPDWGNGLPVFVITVFSRTPLNPQNLSGLLLPKACRVLDHKEEQLLM